MHEIASEQSSAAEPETPAPRRGRAGLWVSGAIVLATLAGGAVQLWANLDYDSALDDFLRSRTAAVPIFDALTEVTGRAEEVSAAAAALSGVTSPELFPAKDRSAIAQAGAALETALADAEEVADAPPRRPGEKPVWPWDLFPGASDLRQRAGTLDGRADLQKSMTQELGARTDEVDDLGTTITAAADRAVPAIEAAGVDARFAPIIALRKAGEEAATAASRFDQRAADAMLALDKATAAVKASAKAELAAKAGPLFDARRQAEAYARSISGGVLLEFEWTEYLLGQGDRDSAAGTATWDGNDGGTSHITLTNSVARYWPDDRMRALVTHEVGHAISAKCYEKFDWQNSDANEQWATAWAMSKGFSAFDSGADIYGSPPQSMLEASSSCR